MTPARWLTDHRHLLPVSGDALDVACGRGRNAIWLAERGFRTRALDRDAEATGALMAEAARRSLPLIAESIDLEQPGVSLGQAAYDLIVVVHYLHRPLIPALIRALRPNGVLVYETFTRAQAAYGRPTNPAFLLDEGELRALIRPLDLIVEREGHFEGKWLASVIATVPGSPARQLSP